MSDKDLQDRSPSTPPVEHPDPAEAKRLEARRRFVKNSAAGSSAVVFTLYHTKSFAGKDQGKKVVLSTAEACLSIGGTPGKKPIKVKDSVTGKKVEKIECELP